MIIPLKMLPLVLAGGIAAHGKGSIKDKIARMTGSLTHAVNKQRMSAVLYAIQLEEVTESGPVAAVQDRDQLLRFIRANVRIKDKPDDDPARDMWGTEYDVKNNPQSFTLVSAGPDKKFGTSDDDSARQKWSDY